MSPMSDLALAERPGADASSGAVPARPAAMHDSKTMGAVNLTAKRVMYGRCRTQGHAVRVDVDGCLLLRVHLTPAGMPDRVISELRASLPEVRIELIYARAVAA